MVVQSKPLQRLIRLRVIDQDKQGIVQMLTFGVFTKGGDLHNPFKLDYTRETGWPEGSFAQNKQWKLI